MANIACIYGKKNLTLQRLINLTVYVSNMQYIHFMPILGQGVKIRLCILGLFKDQPILKLIQKLILYIMEHNKYRR